jgi:hypothetical protein
LVLLRLDNGYPLGEKLLRARGGSRYGRVLLPEGRGMVGIISLGSMGMAMAMADDIFPGC